MCGLRGTSRGSNDGSRWGLECFRHGFDCRWLWGEMFLFTSRWDFRCLSQSADAGNGTTNASNLGDFRFFRGFGVDRFLGGHHSLIRNRWALLDRLWLRRPFLSRNLFLDLGKRADLSGRWLTDLRF